MAIQIYQIQIALQNFRPKIWRRLLIPEDVLLSDLHKIIQTAMGWQNAHLHQFSKNNTYYTIRFHDDDFWDEATSVDYVKNKIKLADLLTTEKETLLYEYDFGDGWMHNIILEKKLPVDKNKTYPTCLTGKMSCPPEDCGGVWGYSDLLAVLKQPDHEEYKNYREWLGDEFDPACFDKDEVNELLKTENFGT